MKQVITTEKQPIKLWLDDIEAGALAQVRNLANLPFIFKHVAVMADAHLGYGMPIGGVMASAEVVIPNAVGVDIGCGMCAVQTSLASISTDQLKMVLAKIRSAIPLGFKHHIHKQHQSLMPMPEIPLEQMPVVDREYQNARTQLGTLGGGNHFIEIQKGNDGHIWMMVHSGSRNLGFKVANHYNHLAIDLNRQWGSKISPKWQLAFLPLDSAAGQIYLQEMRYCVEFAYANRLMMMERVKDALLELVGPVFFEPMINIAHNYAALEEHFGKRVMVHRKGATRAQAGEIGIIPGAGRIMGRKQAQRQLSLEQEKKRLDKQGIIHSIRSVRDLDEAAGAYKNIDKVIDNQLDLVEVLVELSPLAVIKG